MPSSDDSDGSAPAEHDSSRGAGTRGDEERRAERSIGGGVELPVVATGDLAGAQSALEQAEDTYAAAQDTVADLEGQIAVLDDKAAAVQDDESKEEWQQAAAREDVAKANRDFRRAGRKLERAEAHLERAAEQVEAEMQALAAAPPAEPEKEPPPPEPRFATVDLFVEQFVLPNWVHKYASGRGGWCAHWWEHAEAITRLEAIWEAFEVMRLQPAPSFSTWLRDHFDVHMRTLTDPEGVFYKCDFYKGIHSVQRPWRAEPAPKGMFAEIESAQIQRAVDAGASEAPGSETPAGAGLSASNGKTNHAPAADQATAHIARHTTSGVGR